MLRPFFQVWDLSLAKARVQLGRAEGVVRPWAGGWVLHLDSMWMSRATQGLKKSIFELGPFVGVTAMHHGFDRRCHKAELLTINNTDLYHSKVVWMGPPNRCGMVQSVPCHTIPTCTKTIEEIKTSNLDCVA
ncbi:hypothetical protein Taro_025978 [Colocasia esculenta]|uniref:Uncharacterized protein n=1 Tax=Colocasia esculenta TaxID=4460 RepID=A0A843VI57_COLES|nr:hypothetical protein [Colocasia esculenta]